MVRHRDNTENFFIALLLLCNVAVLNNLALSYRKSGQIQKALEAYEEVVEMKTRNKATPVLSLSTCKCDTFNIVSSQISAHLMYKSAS